MLQNRHLYWKVYELFQHWLLRLNTFFPFPPSNLSLFDHHHLKIQSLFQIAEGENMYLHSFRHIRLSRFRLKWSVLHKYWYDQNILYKATMSAFPVPFESHLSQIGPAVVPYIRPPWSQWQNFPCHFLSYGSHEPEMLFLVILHLQLLLSEQYVSCLSFGSHLSCLLPLPYRKMAWKKALLFQA